MCLIQRAISYHDLSTRLTYAYLKAFLVDPTVTKVVLIGHSQGGIIVSMAIDDLLAQLPARTMSKLEVYTFGSAASHFSNPSLASLSNPSANKPGEQISLEVSHSGVDLADANQSEHLIPHMEHYANEYDIVPRWGVLHSVHDVLNTRYAGSIFVRMGASGMWDSPRPRPLSTSFRRLSGPEQGFIFPDSPLRHRLRDESVLYREC